MNAVLDRRVFLKLSFSMLVKVWGAGASFLLSLAITRSMSIEDAGLFFLCIALVLVASVISRQGFDNLLVKLISQFSNEKNYSGVNVIVLWALIRVMFVGFLLAVLVNICSEFLAVNLFNKPELSKVLFVFSFSFFFAPLIQIFVSVFKGNRAPVLSMFFMTAAVPTLMMFLMFFIDVNSALDAAYLFVFSNMLVLVTAIIVWFLFFFIKSEKFISASGLKAQYSNALIPFFYTSLLFVLIQYFTQIYVGAVLSSEDIAMLSVALRVSMLISFVMVAVNSVASPVFSVCFKNNDLEKLKDFSNRITKILFVFGFCSSVFVMIFSEYILSFFGSEYVQAVWLLNILVIGQFINVSTGSVGAILQMSGNEKSFLKCVAISSFLTVLGSVVFIPYFGVMAAALIVSFGVALQNILALFSVKRKLGFYSLNFKV